MHKLGVVLSTHRVYFVGYTLLLLLFLVPQLFFTQQELFLLVNGSNNSFQDFIFYWFTYLGDGLFFTLIIVALLFISYSKSLLGLITFLSTSFIAQFIKRVIFPLEKRPFGELASEYNLHIPSGVEPITTLSFPSGHTVTAFAIATLIVLVYPNKRASYIFLAIAWLVGYSRIYLTHHYPVDVWVGSIIGTLGTLLIYWLLAARFENKFGEKSILNR